MKLSLVVRCGRFRGGAFFEPPPRKKSGIAAAQVRKGERRTLSSPAGRRGITSPKNGRSWEHSFAASVSTCCAWSVSRAFWQYIAFYRKRRYCRCCRRCRRRCHHCRCHRCRWGAIVYLLSWWDGVPNEEVMEDKCTMRPCATDFSIAAIMSRHGRARTRSCRDRDPPDPILPLGKNDTWKLKNKEPFLKLKYANILKV